MSAVNSSYTKKQYKIIKFLKKKAFSVGYINRSGAKKIEYDKSYVNDYEDCYSA